MRGLGYHVVLSRHNYPLIFLWSQVREVARLEAAAKVVSKLQDPEQPVGKGRGRGRGRHGRGTKQAAVQETRHRQGGLCRTPSTQSSRESQSQSQVGT